MFTIPILLVLLLLAKFWTMYAVPYLIHSGIKFVMLEEYILPAVQADVQIWQVLAFCLALALLIGMPLEIKFSKYKSMAYQRLWFFTQINNKRTMALLAIVKAKHGYVTATDLVAQSELLTLGSANNILSKLQKRGFIDLSVSPSGEILYYFPGFDQREAVQREEKKSDGNKRRKKRNDNKR